MAKILYVEDERAIADLVRENLEEQGHQVLLARSAAQGLEAAARERPDLILLDIGLGPLSLDGWGLFAELRARPQSRSIPVVALTARAHRVADRERALREGFAEHVTKPIDFDLLLDVIAGVLGKTGAAP
jgi:DNA-binding response OmpR family regulator